MALSALRTRLGLGLGRCCPTRIAKVGAGGNGNTAATAVGHNIGVGGFGKTRHFSSRVDTSPPGPVSLMIGLIVAVGQITAGYLVADHFLTMGENVAKIQVAVDQLVQHQTKPPVPSDTGNEPGVDAWTAKPTS